MALGGDCGGGRCSRRRRWFLKTPEAALKEVPLTTYSGYEGDPTLSPDGNQVAFVWDDDKENEPTRRLYVVAGWADDRVAASRPRQAE